MTDDFKIIISSDHQYDQLCAEIFYKDSFIAILTQENGFKDLKLEIEVRDKKEPLVLPCVQFEQIIRDARELLNDMNKQQL